MKLKKIIKRIAESMFKILGFVIRPWFRLIYKRSVVVKIEGGISSQLEQYVFGQCLKKAGGYDVSYDISTYVDGHSLDVLGKNARNFDILKLDNSLILNIASGKKLFLHKYFFPYSMDKKKCAKVCSNSQFKTPVYFGGYGYSAYTEEVFEEVYANCVSIEYREEEFGDRNSELLSKLENKDTIAVHVRRGDTLLAKVGRPVPKKEYYLEAIDMFDSSLPIYFFSDDMQWVKEQIVPNVSNKERCNLVDWNGADKGWCDLILMANCRHIIKSPTGGLGREAFRLNKRLDKELVLPVFVSGNNAHMKGQIKEIVLNDTLCDLSYVSDRNIRV